MLKVFRRIVHFFGHSFLTLLALVFTLFLSLASIAPYVDPNVFCLPNLLALALPILACINLFLLIYWSARKKVSALIPLASLFLAIGIHLVRFYDTPPATLSSLPDNAQVFRVLSYNVNLFRLYSWADSPPTASEIAALVRRTEADIICLQEFTTSDATFPDSAARKLFAPFSHIHYTLHHGDLHHGVALFSKYPILERGVIEFPDSYNCAIYADLRVGSDTLRVYSTHFQSFRLHRNNLNFIRSPRFTSSDNLLFEISDIFKKLYRTLQRQAQQAQYVKNSISTSPHPVLLCGDFNATPFTYTYATVSQGMYDTFNEIHKGYGATFSTLFPPMRIDFILHPPEIFPYAFQVLHAPYSDHYPVLASFAFSKSFRK